MRLCLLVLPNFMACMYCFHPVQRATQGWKCCRWFWVNSIQDIQSNTFEKNSALLTLFVLCVFPDSKRVHLACVQEPCKQCDNNHLSRDFRLLDRTSDFVCCGLVLCFVFIAFAFRDLRGNRVLSTLLPGLFVFNRNLQQLCVPDCLVR